ncbi:hypothetical protein E3O42_02945 [Cryobacterium adonitolivorans]|uniref:Uncharacterized protein n=1 Tax=Cryobacterium adonitolivorans TaxID=1259189 RepID=A0A4R8WD70_9MICO|nr:hypothetical protein [Cryobacterium adonitolivorans]TFC05532.1 hypothetical protein E3O42_02945 [Cryobacterium adonitolivorans]
MAPHPALVGPAVHGTDRVEPRRWWWLALLVVGWFNLMSALGGGLGLILANGMGMPMSWLAGTPFDSYLIPGLILMLIVSGTQALAVLGQHRRQPWYPAAAGVAGFGMVVWVYVEVALLPVYSFLHTLYFATGLAQLIFLLLCLGILPASTSGRSAAREYI